MSFAFRSAWRGAAPILLALVPNLSAHAATQCINQNAPAPLEICVQDTGQPAVWVDQPNGRTGQYYGDSSWGSSISLGGTDPSLRFSSGYHDGAILTPVSNVKTGTGSAADPYVITTTVNLAATGVRFTQRFSYVNGDRNFRKTWKIENLGSTTFNDLRFFHGGDTYFGGDDSARSWYDAGLRLVYVNNSDFSNSGYMGFYASPLTPFAHYFSGGYGTGYNLVSVGLLNDSSDSNFVDAGYDLQWDRASLAPGQLWVIEAFETWSPPGSLQVLAPADEYASPGSTVRKTFKVHNLDDTNSITVAMTASTPLGWTTSLVGSASLSLNPLEAASVQVDVQVPANSAPGTSDAVRFNVTDGALNSMLGSSRVSVPNTDYTFSTQNLNFGTQGPSQHSDLNVTLTNGSTAVAIGQVAGADVLVAPYSIVSDNCSNTTVGANASCAIVVRFAPTMPGDYADAFSVPVTSETLIGHTIVVTGSSVDSHVVGATAGTGGSVSPTSVTVPEGNSTSFTVTPDSGYAVDAVTGCSGALTGTTYATGAITAACTVSATFTRSEVAVATAAGSGGSVSPTSISVPKGNSTSFTITADSGYAIDTVTGCNGTLTGTTFATGAITAACTVSATFAHIAVTVATTVGTGGAVTASGGTAHYGERATFTITPATGYVIDSVAGCGGVLSGNTYTTAPLSGPCGISAAFKQQVSDVTVTGRGNGNGGGGAFNWTLLGGLLLLALVRRHRGVMLAIAGLGAAASVNAADLDAHGFYAGASLARASSSETANDLTSRLQARGYDVIAHIDDSRPAWRLHGGWTLNRYVSFEGGYSDLGDVTTSYDGAIPVLSVDAFLADATAVHPRSADGFDASIVGQYPFGERFAVRAQVGGFFWDAVRDVRTTDGRAAHDRDSGTDLLWGVGFDLGLSQHLGMTAQWSRYGLDDEDVSTVSMGVRYRW